MKIIHLIKPAQDIWIEDVLFDNDDTQTIKNVSKEILDVTDPVETIALLDDDFKFSVTITIEDDIDIPSGDDIAIDAPPKLKIITDQNRLCLASNRIKKKYICQKAKGTLKKAKNKAADWLKKAGFLGTDDLQTIDYNNDTNKNDLHDVETINYNNDTNISDLDNINLKETSGAQVKKIVKKYRNLARKKPYQRPSQNNSDDLADLETIDYNNDTGISDLNDIVTGSKKGTQITAKKV